MYKSMSDNIDGIIEDYPETARDLFKEMFKDLSMEHENLRIMIESNRFANEVMKKYMKKKI